MIVAGIPAIRRNADLPQPTICYRYAVEQIMPWSEIPGDHIVQLLLEHSGLTYSDLQHKLIALLGTVNEMELLNCLWELAEHGLLTLDGHSGDKESLCHAIRDQLWKRARSTAKLRASAHYLEVQSALGLLRPRSILRSREPRASSDRMATAVITWPLFGEPRPLPIKADIFVVMPFSALMLPVYRDHIIPVTQSLGLSTMRADDLFTNNSVMNDVWSGIFYSRVIIADCTGRNPNVFYENGMAHCLGMDTILITQQSDDVPVDIRHMKYIAYEYTPPGMKGFEANLRLTLQMVCHIKDS